MRRSQRAPDNRTYGAIVSAMSTAQDKADAKAAASYLGSLARGKPKRLTDAERKRRGARLAEARKLRWPEKTNEHNTKPIV